MAEAATIEHGPLARIASAQFRSLLDVVVVADMAARARLVAMLADSGAVPDMLAQSHSAQYRYAGVPCLPMHPGGGRGMWEERASG